MKIELVGGLYDGHVLETPEDQEAEHGEVEFIKRGFGDASVHYVRREPGSPFFDLAGVGE